MMQYRTIVIMTDSYEVICVLSFGTKIIDLGWPWTADTHSVAEMMHLLKPTAKIWIKIDPHYQRQKCRPISLGSGTAIFTNFHGYFFGNFTIKATIIILRQAVSCQPVSDYKMNGYFVQNSVFVPAVFSRLYCYTVWSAIGSGLLSVCLSVCLSVRPSVRCDAVHCGSQGWCTQLKLAPACS